MQAKHESSSWSLWYFGFLAIKSLNASTKRSITDRLKLTPDSTTIGRWIRSWSSLKSRAFTRIANSVMPVRVGFTMMLTNCTDSGESWLIRCVSLYIYWNIEVRRILLLVHYNYLHCNKSRVTLMGYPHKIRRRLDDPVFSCNNRRYSVHAAH